MKMKWKLKKKKMKFNLTKLKTYNNKIILVIDYIKKNIIMNLKFLFIQIISEIVLIKLKLIMYFLK